MTKRKTDETTTRKARAKGAEAPATEGNGPDPRADAPVASKAKGRKPKGGPKAKTPSKEKPPKEDLVVFAFRLKPEERDLIHRAAGPAKASKFVRALVTAASRKDLDTVRGIVEAIEA